LVTLLPIDDKQVVWAAKDMMAEHGDAAIAQANQRHQTWELIREVIRDLQESDFKEGQT